MLDELKLNGRIFKVGVDAFRKEHVRLYRAGADDIVVFSFNAFDELDLLGEIEGEYDSLAGLCDFSAASNSTVFCGVTSSILGIKHISVAVCHKGRLVDIVDRTSNITGDEYGKTKKIKIFALDDIKIAVLVDTDILIEENLRKTAPACDVILALIKSPGPDIAESAVNSAKKYGKPCLCVYDEGFVWFDQETIY